MTWIKVEDGLPNIGEAVLTIDKFYPEAIALGILEDHEEEAFLNASIVPLPVDFNVTHWMPLPQPPEEK